MNLYNILFVFNQFLRELPNNPNWAYRYIKGLSGQLELKEFFESKGIFPQNCYSTDGKNFDMVVNNFKIEVKNSTKNLEIPLEQIAENDYFVLVDMHPETNPHKMYFKIIGYINKEDLNKFGKPKVYKNRKRKDFKCINKKELLPIEELVNSFNPKKLWVFV